MGGHRHTHRPRPSLQDGIAREVGEDPSFDKGAGLDDGAGPPPLATTFGDLRHLDLRGPDVPMAKPLYHRATSHHGFLETRERGIGLQDEREGVGKGIGDLVCQ